jgi:hypothetical protein
MSNTARRLTDHIQRLCETNDIAIIVKPHAHARAEKVRVKDGNGETRRRRGRRIVIQPVKGYVTYFIALHELGHHLGEQPPRRLEQEVGAWRWALSNASVSPTRGVWKHIARCLESYERRALRWKNMQLPPEDHDYWRLLETARVGGL